MGAQRLGDKDTTIPVAALDLRRVGSFSQVKVWSPLLPYQGHLLSTLKTLLTHASIFSFK